MGTSKLSFTLLHILILLMLLTVFLLIPTYYCEKGTLEKSQFKNSESTDYGFPEDMYDDVANYECWDGESYVYYYYLTQSASSSYYHVIWFQPTDPADIFRLFVYKNSINGESIISTWSEGYDWVVIRPSNSMRLFGTIQKPPSISGYAYIEWEIGSQELSPNISSSASLALSEKIELYKVVLSKSFQYTINLIVPSTGDYDIYLYYCGLGQADRGEDFLLTSENSGNGLNETIENFNPENTGEYALLVVRKSGSGIYNLALTLLENTGDSSEIPIDGGYIFLGIVTIFLFFFQRKKAVNSTVLT